jgi:hypothetical protein
MIGYSFPVYFLAGLKFKKTLILMNLMGFLKEVTINQNCR